MAQNKNKKTNNTSGANTCTNTVRATADRMYHNTEHFLYKYRWLIVLILAILLAWYIYCHKKELGANASALTNTVVTSLGYQQANPGANVAPGLNATSVTGAEPSALWGGSGLPQGPARLTANDLNINEPSSMFGPGYTETRKLFKL